MQQVTITRSHKLLEAYGEEQVTMKHSAPNSDKFLRTREWLKNLDKV
jgi:hypothetical protein